MKNYNLIILILCFINSQELSCRGKSASHKGSSHHAAVHQMPHGGGGAGAVQGVQQQEQKQQNDQNSMPIGMANPNADTEIKNAPKLIAEINNLIANYVILSYDIQRFIKQYYDVGNKQPNALNKNTFYSDVDHWNKFFVKEEKFNPSVEVITPNGDIIAGQTGGSNINPLTNVAVTHQDIPMLKFIKKLLISEIDTIIVALSAMISARWYADYMKSKDVDGASHWLDNMKRQGEKYLFINKLSKFFMVAADNIANGELEIKKTHKGIIAH